MNSTAQKCTKRHLSKAENIRKSIFAHHLNKDNYFYEEICVSKELVVDPNNSLHYSDDSQHCGLAESFQNYQYDTAQRHNNGVAFSYHQLGRCKLRDGYRQESCQKIAKNAYCMVLHDGRYRRLPVRMLRYED